MAKPTAEVAGLTWNHPNDTTCRRFFIFTPCRNGGRSINMAYSSHLPSRKKTPQSQAIPGREAEMATNNAGGVTFTVTPWQQLDRFLILGSEGGTYYASAKAMTEVNTDNLQKLLISDGPRVVQRIVEISEAGRAPRNNAAVFALALAASAKNDATRAAAFEALPKVCRIPTHLFEFVEACNKLRGWGTGLRKAVSRWYLDRPVDQLAYQMVKYQQRGGWSHHDVFSLCHIKTEDPKLNGLFSWAKRRADAEDAGDLLPSLPAVVAAYHDAQSADTSRLVQLIEKHKMTWEMIPKPRLKQPDVWNAMLPHMPLTALIRNLAVMTANGTLSVGNSATRQVLTKLSNVEQVKQARIHPLSVLFAMKTYVSGGGFRGKLKWAPVRKIVDALDDLFYASFGFVKPTGKRWLLALDSSSSMCTPLANSCVNAREATAAMAMMALRVEQDVEVVTFTGGRSGFRSSTKVAELNISAKMRLDTVVKVMEAVDFGSTDCALPFLFAKEKKLKVDAVAVYTDNETWAGSIQPVQALKQYRQSSGLPTKSVVVGMTSTGFTIADPRDAGMMDVVGFDAATPRIIGDFVAPEIEAAKADDADASEDALED